MEFTVTEDSIDGRFVGVTGPLTDTFTISGPAVVRTVLPTATPTAKAAAKPTVAPTVKPTVSPTHSK